MILIFDYFETIALTKVMDFNLGLKPLWEKYYKDKCTFEEISAFGEELYVKLQEFHKKGLEYAFVKDELPEYALKYGGDVINMTVEEEAEFLMLCNVMENMPYIPEALEEFNKMGIPMYVLSNSGFTAEALAILLERLGIRKYFKQIWSSADYGKVKPSRDFFEMAIEHALSDNPAEKRENIIFVGDTYNTDVKGANDAGIDVIWINHKDEKNTDNLSVHTIRNTSELVGVVKMMMKDRKDIFNLPDEFTI
ncbi:MAG: HAD family hydrolase [Lachnospiraceae bacterium]|nr:HAD family hydrolase [Lachnospiraceae bacterium]